MTTRERLRSICRDSPGMFTPGLLSHLLGVSRTRIRVLAEEEHLQLAVGVPGTEKKRMTDQRVEDCYELGFRSVKEIAEHTGLDPRTVSISARRQGLRLSRYVRTGRRQEQVVNFARANPHLSVAELAQQLGLRSSNVSMYLRGTGIRPPDGRRSRTTTEGTPDATRST